MRLIKSIKLSRIMSIILGLSLLFIVVPAPVCSAADPEDLTMTCSDGSVNLDGTEKTVTVKIGVEVPQNLTTRYLRVCLVYDDTKVSCSSCTVNSQFASPQVNTAYTVPAGSVNSGKKALYISYTSATGILPAAFAGNINGDNIATVTFTVPASATEGVIALQFDATNTMMGDQGDGGVVVLNNVNFDDGTIELNSSTVTYGDVNANGVINGQDVIILKRYLAGMSPEINLANADVNGNGAVNGQDVIILKRYLAGMSVTLGP